LDEFKYCRAEIDMSANALRRELKKAIDRLPPERLETVADFIAFVNRPTLKQRVQKAEEEFKANKGTNWRKVRDDV
jgi:hypothetical protein